MFSISKPPAQVPSLAPRNDRAGYVWYMSGMAEPQHDWYLKEWLRYAGKSQADVVRDLDWNKARVSLMARGKQEYTRDAINELATYLNIAPFELLMHPDDAASLKRLRSTAMQAIENGKIFDQAPAERTGTKG
jgi:transcriptional regulator with XRE-family HTH domain